MKEETQGQEQKPQKDGPESLQEHNIRTRNRRRMAYISLFCIIIVTYWVLFFLPIERLKVLSDVITWFYFSMISIVGAYMGFTVIEHIKKK